MSYGLYIGRNHTADGQPYLAGYGDEPSSHWLEICPAADHDPDATITVGMTEWATIPGHLIQIPQVPRTARNMRVSYSFYVGVPAPLTNGGVNEHGVAVRDIWSPTRDELRAMKPTDQTGPNYSDLARIVLERARTAREAVDLIGSLIAEHGYSCYGGNSHMIADADEAWVVIEFSGGQKLWCAERLGPDSIRASRPGFIGDIPDAPNDDFLFPAHFRDVAIAQGWYSPGDGPFHVNRIYGDAKGRWEGVDWIETEMRRRAANPGKITLRDIFWAISTEKLTGDTAGYGQVVPLAIPDHPELRMMWHAPIGAVAAPLLPVFLWQDEVPPAYREHRYMTTGESHRFMDSRHAAAHPDSVSHVPQGIETGGTAVYEFKRLMHLAFQRPDPILQEITDHWRAIEGAVLRGLPDVLSSAAVLLQAGARSQALALLQRASTVALDSAYRECRILADAAHIRLQALGHLNLTRKPQSPTQIW